MITDNEQVDSPTFGVGRAQLIKPEDDQNKKIIEAYKQFIYSSVYLLADYTSNISLHLEDDINKMVQFEMELAKISADNVVRRNKTLLYGNKTTIKEFGEKYENIPLSAIEREVFIGVLDGVVNESSGLIVYDRDYFENVGQILERYNNDDNRT
jgi:predicted metalloendopeptidase